MLRLAGLSGMQRLILGCEMRNGLLGAIEKESHGLFYCVLQNVLLRGVFDRRPFMLNSEEQTIIYLAITIDVSVGDFCAQS